jgi:hypothetical protein
MTIGVMGCLPTLPMDFPVTYPENAGNMIHANAPFEMFDDCVFIRDGINKLRGEVNFSSFVNKYCSHLVITLANTLKFGEVDGTKYIRLIEFIEKINVPVVVFGLGIQSIEDDYSNMSLPSEAIDFIKLLSEKSRMIGVRGDMTKKALYDLCGVDNVMITGCPSFFSRPHTLPMLRKNLANPIGRIAYNGTHYYKAMENKMLFSAVRQDEFLVEPVNKHNHIYYQSILRGEASNQFVPYYFKEQVKKEKIQKSELKAYFQSRYKLFRGVSEWYSFNEEFVSATYGTRFHANMASLISGKPALWVTHDARTRELTQFLNLPSVAIEDACNVKGKDLLDSYMNYDSFFETIGDLYDNFNNYLTINGLPKIKYFEYL